MYHQVGQPLNERGAGDCVSPERFEQQIRAILDAGYRIVSLSTFLRRLRQGAMSDLSRCAVLTFDDGFRDQFVNAYPILRRYDVPATVFLIAAYVGRDVVFPHLATVGAGVSPGWHPLGWHDVRTMARAGIEIGSHTVSHRSLGLLAPAEARREVEQSREILEEGVGQPVTLFAYPFGSQAYGDFDGQLADVLREAGYDGACTTVVGTNDQRADAFALRRIPIDESDGAFRIRCKLVGAYDWVRAIKSSWQRLVPREDRVDADLVR